MTKKIFLNGTQYIGSKEAGKSVGYSYDYVSRLARQGVVKAEKIGNSWFVDPKSLKNFAKNQKINSTVRSKQLAQQVSGAMGTANKTNPSAISPSMIRMMPNVSSGFSTMGSGMSAMGMANRLIALITATSLVFGLYSFTDAQYARHAQVGVTSIIQNTLKMLHDLPDSVFAYVDDFTTGFEAFAQAPDTYAINTMLGASALADTTFEQLAIQTARFTDDVFSKVFYGLSLLNPKNFANISDKTIVHIGIKELPMVDSALRAQVVARASVDTQSKGDVTTSIEGNSAVSTGGGTRIINNTIVKEVETRRETVREVIPFNTIQSLIDSTIANNTNTNNLRTELLGVVNDALSRNQISKVGALSLTQRIDQLSGVDFKNGTITNSPISGSTGSFTTLSASGATSLTGITAADLTLSGNLTVAGSTQLAITTITDATISNGLTVSGGDVSLPNGVIDSSEITDGTITGTDISDGSVDISTDTNLVAGSDITLTDDTLSVDDSFLRNDGDDTTSGTITAAGFTTTGGVNAATGTFTGALSALSATITNALNATSATISGTLTALTGAFTNLTATTATTTDFIATNSATLATTTATNLTATTITSDNLTLTNLAGGTTSDVVLVRDATGVVKTISMNSVGRTTFAGLDDTTLTALADADMVIYDTATGQWRNKTISGDITITDEGVATISANAVALGTDTTGSYVQTVTGNSQITVSGADGEGSTKALSITADSIGDTQLTFNTGQHLTTTSSPTFAGQTVNGNITVTGTVDGRDIATDGTKLDTIETGADVTDTTNVTAAGALMDSELTSLSGVKSLTLPDSATISTFGATLTDDTTASAARTTLGVDPAGTDNSTNVTLAGALDYLTIVGQTITRNAINLATDITGILGISNGGTGASTAAGARTNLGLEIDSDVQSYNANTTLLGQTIESVEITNGTIDEVDLDTSVNASLDLADSALQSESDTLDTVADRGATTNQTLTAGGFTTTGTTATGALTASGTATVTGDLTVDTNTLYVDSTNNRVGVGTVAPIGTTHIYTSDTGLAAVSTNADGLVIEENGSTGLTILTRNISKGNIYFADGDHLGLGRVTYDHSNDELGLTAGGGERVTLTSALFTVNPTGTGTDIKFNGQNNDNVFYLDASADSIGIGDTTPDYLLDVAGTFGVDGAATLGSTLGVTGATTLSSTLAVSGLSALADVTVSDLTASRLVATDASKNLVSTLTEANLESSLSDVSNVFTNNDTITMANIADSYLLNTGDTATGDYNFDSNTFVVDSVNNRVGVGTATPSTKLEVLTAGAEGIKLVRSDGERVAWLTDNSTGTGSMYLFNGSNGNSVFITGNGNSFLNGGNVGIGDTTPDYLLDVAGTFGVDGAATLSSTLGVTGLATFSAGVNVNSETITDFTGTGLTLTAGALGTTLGTSIEKVELTNSGTLSFDWVDSEVSDALTISGGTVNNTPIGATTPAAGTFTNLTVNAQCVTADTRLRRRRRRRKDEKDSDLDKDLNVFGYDNDFVYEYIQIIDLKKGDEVASLDQHTGEFTYSKVNEMMPMGIQQLIKLTTMTGRSIRTTDKHPYFVRTKYTADTNKKSQKLYRFEVDQSIKIETYTKDSIIAIANTERSIVITVPKELKQRLRDNLRRYNAPQKMKATIFAAVIVEALQNLNAEVHELVVDEEYSGYDTLIADIISAHFPTIEVSIELVGKKSPAHYSAYGVHTKQKTADAIATTEVIGRIAENALRTPFLAHKGESSGSPRASLTNSVYNGVEFVNNGEWRETKELKVNQYIAVAHNNLPAWEKIVKIEVLKSEMVYDVEIEGTKNFIGNDIIAHNTYLKGALHDAGNSAGASGQVLTSTGTSTAWVDASTLTVTETDTLDTVADRGATTNQTLTAGGFTTTGTTATGALTASGTATVTGDLTVDTNTLYVDSANNRVGVGTVAPTQALEVNGSIRVASNGDIIGGASSLIGFDSIGNGQSPLVIYGDPMYLKYFDGSTYQTGIYMAETTGLVGIGTTTPSYKLDVNGTFRTVGAGLFDSTLGVTGLATFGAGVNVNGETITDFTGTGLSLSAGVLSSTLGTAIDSSEITDGTIVNADINSSAAISISKTALTAGTNITLTGDTLNVDDAFLVNNADDTTTGTITAAGFTTTGATQTGTATVTGDLTVDTNTLYVDATNNRVGIGTVTPEYALDVVGAPARIDGTLYFRAGTSADNKIVVSRPSLSIIDSNGGYLNLNVNGRMNANELQFESQSMQLLHTGVYGFRNPRGSGWIQTNIAEALAMYLNDNSIGNVSTIIKTTNAGTAIDAIYAQYDGNVGIGTTAPSYKLDVAGTGRFTGDLTLNAGLKDKDGDLGTSGQILTTTGTSTNWVDASTLTVTETDTLDTVADRGATTNQTLTAAGFTTTGTTATGALTASGTAAVTGDLTVDTNTLYVDATNNRVGIGTVSPDTPFTVQTAIANDNIQSWKDSNGTTRLYIDTDASTTYIYGGSNGIGTSGLTLRSTNNSPTTIAAHNGAININPGPYDGLNNFAFTGGGVLSVNVWNTTTSLKKLSSRLTMGLYDESNNLGQIWLRPAYNESLQEGLIIKAQSNGIARVGIGTTSPGAKLHINGTTGTLLQIQGSNSNQTISDYDGTGIAFSGAPRATGFRANTFYQNNSNSSVTLRGNIADASNAVGVVIDNASTLSTSGAKILSIRNNASEKAFIGYDGGAYFAGNVGIGDTTPDYLLDVAGTFGVDGASTLGSTLSVTGLATFGAGVNVNGETITDFTGTGLSLSAGVLSSTLGTAIDSAEITNGTIDEVDLDTSVNASLDLADSALQSESDTLDTVADRGATTNQTLAAGGFTTTGATQTGTATVTGDLTVDTNTLYVDSTNNRVGVGTVTPGEKLEVYDGNAVITSTTLVSGGANQAMRLTDTGLMFQRSNGDWGGGSLTFTPNALAGTLNLYARGNVTVGNSSGSGSYVDVPFSGDVKFYTGDGSTGAERMRITNTGNVGIGTTAPGAKLEVKGSGGDILNLLDSSGNEKITVLSNGNIGVGTSSPAEALHLYGDDQAIMFSVPNELQGRSLRIRIDDDTDSMLFEGIRTNGSIESTPITIPIAYNGEIGITRNTRFTNRIITDQLWSITDTDGRIYWPEDGDFAIYTDGQEHFRIKSDGGAFKGIGIGDMSPDAHLEISADGTTGGNLFLLSSDDNNDGDILTVKESGNVGIGTTSPGAKLHVANSNTAVDSITANIYGNANSEHTLTVSNQNVANSVGLYLRSTTLGTIKSATGADLRLGASNSPNHLNIVPSGNVGIGDTTPDHTLDVAGNIGLDASGYINWGDTDGATGYGFRDNAGTLEYKNLAGAWASIGSGGSSSLFTDGGTTTYLTSLTDDLAIGGTDSTSPLFFDESAELLTLTNTTTGNSFVVNDQASDTTPFIIDTNGNVGIGTTLPAYKLDVSGTGRFTGLATFGAGVNVNSETITDFTGTGLSLSAGVLSSTLGTAIDSSEITDDSIVNADINSSAAISISKTALTAGTNITLSGDTLSVDDAFLINSGDDTTSGTITAAGFTTTGATQTGTATVTGDLTVDTNTLYVDSTNNRVGVGTASPGAKLEIVQSNAANGLYVNQTGAGAAAWFTQNYNTTGIVLDHNATTATALAIDSASGGDALAVYNGATSYLYVKGTGNVGIGTAGPGAKLHVSGGNILLDNNQYLQGKESGGTIRSLFGLDASNELSVGHINNNTNYLGFTHTFSAGGVADKVVIDSSGNVGIGTTNPSLGDLVINRNGAGYNLVLENTASGNNYRMRTMTNGELTFSAGASDKVTFDEVGNVGIGTTSPSAKLDIVGDFEVNPGGSMSVAGDLDLIIGESDGISYAYENTGTASSPVWTAKSAWNTPDVGSWAKPHFADLDNDGDYDLIIGTFTGDSKAYENTGTASSPVWTAKTAWDAPDVGNYVTPSTVDIDNDGDLDLFIGDYVGISYAYENTGTASSPVWTAKSAWNTPDVGFSAAPNFADLDNDGDYDLIQGSEAGISYAYENTGTVSSPVWTVKSAWDVPYVGVNSQPAIGDLDNDGDFDLIIGENGGVSHGYENTGTVSSPVWTNKDSWNTPDIGGYVRPSLIDIDNDGSTVSSVFVMDSIGFGIGVASPSHPVEHISGAYLSAGGSWTNASSRDLKENFIALDNQSILAGINSLDIEQWNYKTEDASILHIGPIAQDFYAEFGLGNSNKSISTIDSAGVALVGIQALSERWDGLAGLFGFNIDELTETSTNIETVTTEMPTFIDRVIAIVADWLDGVGVTITDTLAQFSNLATAAFTVGSAEKPNGITLFDEETGEAYCVKIKGGQMVSEQGECTLGDISQSQVDDSSTDQQADVQDGDTAPSEPTDPQVDSTSGGADTNPSTDTISDEVGDDSTNGVSDAGTNSEDSTTSEPTNPADPVSDGAGDDTAHDGDNAGDDASDTSSTESVDNQADTADDATDTSSEGEATSGTDAPATEDAPIQDDTNTEDTTDTTEDTSVQEEDTVEETVDNQASDTNL